MKKRKYLITLILMAFLATGTGCSTSGKDGPEESTEEVEVLYNRAASALDSGNYQEAGDLFEEVERQYPYSKWSTQAQLMAAFAAYRDLRYDEAVLALDRFIELHPGHPDVDYAYYLRAMSFYERINDVKRDQASTRNALNAFNALIRRFPDSKYAKDSIYKRDLTLDHMAGKEMMVGRYYLKKEHYNAAINRFQNIVKEYQTTTHVAEALHRLVESYLSLGLKGQATKVAAVLGHNYPGSEWYERSYRLLDPEEREKLREEKPWLRRTIDDFLKPRPENGTVSDNAFEPVIVDELKGPLEESLSVTNRSQTVSSEEKEDDTGN